MVKRADGQAGTIRKKYYTYIQTDQVSARTQRRRGRDYAENEVHNNASPKGQQGAIATRVREGTWYIST